MTAKKEAFPFAFEDLMKRHRAVMLEDLLGAERTRSRMTVFRRLRAVGYLTSFTHTGRYYTLASIPDFDENGLWFHEDIGFSRAGTLMETVATLVAKAKAGKTHRELEAQLRVRVHNTLLQLVEKVRIGRERLDRSYVYVDVQEARRIEQVAARRALVRGDDTVALPSELVISILIEALRAGEVLASASVVADRLSARGTSATEQQVTLIYAEYGLVPGKKTEEPPLGLSRS